jgi:hypothetical protein
MMTASRVSAAHRPMSIMIYMVARNPQQNQLSTQLVPQLLKFFLIGSTYESNKEENNVHNPKRKARLQHTTRLHQIHRKRIMNRHRRIQKPQRNLRARCIPGPPMNAVIVGDIPQIVHPSNEGADKQQVHHGAEVRVVLGRSVRQESCEGPETGEYGDDEEHENEGWGEVILRRVVVHEPAEHADGGDEGDDFKDAPGEEGEAGQHGGYCLMVISLNGSGLEVSVR